MPPQENVNEYRHEIDSTGIKKGFSNPVFVSEDKETDKEEKTTQLDQKIGNEKEPFEFDHLLPLIGEFGVYQKLLFVLMIPFSFFVAWVYFSQIFITIVPEKYWCWIPELANLTVEERYVKKLAFIMNHFNKIIASYRSRCHSS